MPLPTELEVRDWAAFQAAFERDRIPFLGPLVAHAATRLDFAGRSVLTYDGIFGCASLYLAPLAREVVACVERVSDATHLTALLADAKVENVSVRVTAAERPGGPVVLPFLKKRFGVAVLPLHVLIPATTDRLLQEVTRAIEPGGKVALVLRAHVGPSDPTEFSDKHSVVAPRPRPPGSESPPDFTVKFARALERAGLRVTCAESMVVSLEAPNGLAYLDHIRSRLTTRRTERWLPTEHERKYREKVNPIPLKAYSGLIVAQATTS